MIHQDRIKRILLNHQLISERDIDEAIATAKSKNINLLHYLTSQGSITEEILYPLIATDFGVQFINLLNVTLDKELLSLLPENIVQTREVVVFEKNSTTNTIKIATTDPDDLQTIDFVQKRTGCKSAQIYLTTEASVNHIIKQYHGHIVEEFAEFKQPIEIAALSASEITRDIPIIKMVDTILDYAIFQNASDIHIEPADQTIIVRFRVDGILRDIMTLPKSVQAGLLARVKILANLKLDEHRLPQDGRFSVNSGNDRKVALRVSILPVYDGEKVFLLILDESKDILTLEQLGLNDLNLAVVRRNIAKPHGMLLVTGPTGSGKTTTLYTVLNILNTPQVNISTIEDPIEYRMSRINQSQVNPKIGFTFASGLRALLRQDPNVIMVGEIRDNETAEIASLAAMTGHLVLSTLHTNDAIGSISRLTEMGIPRFLVTSTINLVVAQRLVRKICTDCIQTYQLTKKNIDEISKQFSVTAIIDGFAKLGEDMTEIKSLSELNFYRGVGCHKCGDTGYRGRIGIYEILEMAPELSQAILHEASKSELFQLAIDKTGMITMIQDGFVKAKHGLTTIEEVLRVTRE